MKAEPAIRDDQELGPTMTAEDAVALASCPWDRKCAPACRHCTASREEIEAARQWIASHPGTVEAWRAAKLGAVSTAVRIWEAYPASNAGSWGIRSTDGCGTAALVAELTQRAGRGDHRGSQCRTRTGDGRPRLVGGV